MRRSGLVLTILAAALVPSAAHATTGAPMPLAQVQPGMQCTGYSVFKGTAVETFGVTVDDIVGQASSGEDSTRLMVTVSGPRIDPTGVGPGFSGSPIYCPAADGSMENIGAISETVGDYGGHTVLATPIEQILATAVFPPKVHPKVPQARSVIADARDAAILSNARPIATPLSLGGVSPALMDEITKVNAKRGVTLTAAPSIPASQIPIKPFEPGSAVGVGLSSGHVSLGATGTVAYVDGDKTWLFGHAFDAAGPRSLLLQDAYVAKIINNPVAAGADLSTYKYSGPVHDLGTVRNDGFNAVTGSVGDLPPETSVRVSTKDLDLSKTTRTDTNVVDETDVGLPTGGNALSYVAPIAVLEDATDILGGAPQQLTGNMCLIAEVKERPGKPLKFCNRYVSDGTALSAGYGSNPVANSASFDASSALSLFDTYKGKPIHVTDVTARVSESRRQGQAYIRSITLPHKVTRGATVPFTMVVHVVRGGRETIQGKWTVPNSFRKGKHTIKFTGADPDQGGGFFDVITLDFSDDGSDYDSEGPHSLNALAKAYKALHQYDGIHAGKHRFYRDPNYRIGGLAKAKVVVRKRG